VEGLLVARVFGGDGAQIEQTSGRLDLEVRVGDRVSDARQSEGYPEEEQDQRVVRPDREQTHERSRPSAM
jgi:hypothetical protein